MQQRESMIKAHLEMMKIPRVPNLGDGTDSSFSELQMDMFHNYSKIVHELDQHSQSINSHVQSTTSDNRYDSH